MTPAHMQDKAKNDSSAAHRNEFVQALATGLKVLETFTKDTRQQTLSEVAEQAEITRATARRMLLTLTSLGYLHSSGRTFEMTSKLLSIGHDYWAGRSIRDVLQPVLAALSDRLSSSCSAAVLDGEDIMYVARNNRSQLMRLDLHPGSRLPAVHTAMGRVLAAGLPQSELEAWVENTEIPQYTQYTVTNKTQLLEIIGNVRANGHAWINQELEYGFGSAAVPVYDHQGRACMAINTSMRATNPGRFKDLDEAIPHLKSAAQSIEKLLMSLGMNLHNGALFY